MRKLILGIIVISLLVLTGCSSTEVDKTIESDEVVDYIEGVNKTLSKSLVEKLYAVK